MDVQFASKLQTILQKIGRQGDTQPPRTQDPLEAQLHEYFVAETARSIFDKRKKAALALIKASDTTGAIAKHVDDAAKGATGIIQLYDTANYTCTLQTKTPSEAFDKTVMVNELIKAGVDHKIVADCVAKATSKNKAAETYTVTVKKT